MRRGLRLLVPLGVIIACTFAAPALASEALTDPNVTFKSLAVNTKGEAVVTYTRSDGKVRHVLAWGALNANTPVDPAVRQVRFKWDYAGGWGKYRNASYWKRVKNTCAPYDGPEEGDHGVTVRYADQPVLPASPNREFRYLVNQDVGCPDVTQFVGTIPPGRAGMHSHVYDEVVYVIEGEGVLHIGGDETPIGRGTCIHLPPLVEHCLENTGANPMRVLGVFHPQGDPASRAHES